MAQQRGLQRNRPPSAPSEERDGTITSRDNKWLKLFRAALRGSGPGAHDLIGVEGPRLVEEALRSGLEAQAILVSAAGEHHMDRVLMAATESEGGIRRERILRTTDKLFEGVAGTETPQGVAALFQQPAWSMQDVLQARYESARSPSNEMNGPSGSNENGNTHANENKAANALAAASNTGEASSPALVVVLAGLQDPGNVGTILRSAEAFGATGVVALKGAADPWSPKALRASAGSALRLPVLRGMALPILLAQLKMHRIKIVATRVQSPSQYARGESFAVLRGPAALFIGSEGAGLPAEVERAADAAVSIPMNESVESLNAAVAASLLLYEAARQRKEPR